MPNWCYNEITISHEDPAMIQRLVKASEDDSILQEFIPCPTELMEHGFDPTQMDDYKIKVREWEASNKEKFGFASWYDWRVENWGTKWDIGFSDPHVFNEGKSLSSSFDSAWSPPVDAYEKLKEMGFVIEATYHEPGMCYVGIYTSEDGDCCVEYDFSNPNWRDDMPDELVDRLEDDYQAFLEYEAEAQANEA